VVATRVPATRCVVHGRTGLLVPPDDPPALGDALAALIADPALRDHLGREAASWAAEQHSWAHHVEGVAGAYGWRAEEPGCGWAGLLGPPDDPPALGDALAALIADPALRDHLGREAASWAAEQHSWAHHVEGLAAAYGWTAEETR